jgi:hypothetical protein
MKFILFVEGATEKQGAVDLIRRWLNSPCRHVRVGIKPIDVKGCGNFLREVPRKARLHLSGPDSQQIVGIIGLMDLYGANIFPRHLSTVEEKWQWGKNKLEEEVDHPNFKMFFAVHEVEAWLLSQPEVLKLNWGKELLSRLGRPEEINLQEPPNKLLARIYRAQKNRKYKKPTDGKAFFDKLDPEIAHNKCPYLRQMLDEMLRLAEGRGSDGSTS